jgi:hypothetical protein
MTMGPLLSIPDLHPMERTIRITHSYAGLMAVYARHWLFAPWRAPETRSHRFAAGFAGLVILVTLMAGYFLWALVLFMGSLALLLYLFLWFVNQRWRIRRWARAMAGQGPMELQLGEHGMAYRVQGNERLYAWASVQHALCAHDHISLHMKDELFFTKASMRPEEFDMLCAVVREKVVMIREEQPQGTPPATA